MRCLLLLFLVAGTAFAAEPPVVKRLKNEKIRATSAALSAPPKAKIIKDAGLNTVVTWSYFLQGCPVAPKKDNEPLYDPAALPRSKTMRNEIRLAAKDNMISLPLLWFHKDTVPVMAQKNYRRAVTSEGRLCKVTPCPADRVYWDELVKPFFLYMAQIQKEEGASGGAAVDLEFYAGELTGGFTYGRGMDGCFCDDCFGEFLKRNNVAFDPAAFPPESRWEYLVKRGQYQDYLDDLAGRVTERTAAIRGEVRAVKPDFVFAVMPGGEGWYFDGLARGFGSADIPMLMFSETEYFGGWSARSAACLENIRSKQLPVLLVGGLTVSAYNAEGLAAKVLELAEKCDGYWLYYGESLFSKSPKIIERSFRPSEYALREPGPRYWQAITAVNERLDAGFSVSAAAGSGRELGNADIFPGKASADGIAVPDQAGDAKGRLDGQWVLGGVELTGKTKDVPLKKSADSTVLQEIPNGFMLDLNGRGERETFTYKQTVAVTPKQKYRIRMDICTDDVSFPLNGFEITEAYSKNPYFRHWASSTGGEWKYFERTVTPYNNKVDVRLLVSGATGKVGFRNIVFEELRDFDLTGAGLPELPSTIVLDNPEPVGVEIINPETGLGYFKLENGVNDLRYLKALYPGMPAAIRVSGEVGKDCRNLKTDIRTR